MINCSEHGHSSETLDHDDLLHRAMKMIDGFRVFSSTEIHKTLVKP